MEVKSKNVVCWFNELPKEANMWLFGSQFVARSYDHYLLNLYGTSTLSYKIKTYIKTESPILVLSQLYRDNFFILHEESASCELKIADKEFVDLILAQLQSYA